MKEYRVNITPTAEKDLEQRYLQIAEDSPENAVNWYLGLVDAIGKLDVMAERCPIAPEDVDLQLGTRHLIDSGPLPCALLDQKQSSRCATHSP